MDLFFPTKVYAGNIVNQLTKEIIFNIAQLSLKLVGIHPFSGLGFDCFLRKHCLHFGSASLKEFLLSSFMVGLIGVLAGV